MRILLLIVMVNIISFTAIPQQTIEDKRQAKMDLFLESRAGKGKIGKPYTQIEALLNLLPADTKGKVIYINFWFKECPACVAEFEGLNKLYDIYSSNKRVQIAALTFENSKIIAQMKDKYHLRFPIISVNRKECDKLNTEIGYPTNLIINKDENVAYIKSGGTTDNTKAINYMLNRVAPLIQQQLK